MTPKLFVSFEPDGSTSGGDAAVSTVQQGTDFVLFVDTIDGASYRLHTLREGNLQLGTSSGSRPAFIALWGGGSKPWDVGYHVVTATCTIAGQSAGDAEKIVHITNP